MRTPRGRSSLALVGVVLVLALSAACSSSSGGGSTTTSTETATSTPGSTAEFCANYQALQTSLANLTKLNIVAVGTDGLKAALDDITSKTNALAASAQQQFSPQVDGLKNAVGQLRATFDNLPSGGISSNLTTIGTRIAAIGTAGQALASAVGNACPSATNS